jgi:phosphoserine phosphatase
VEKEGLTLQHSVGVGDTESDMPFLEMVSKPICFNPNEKLYKNARRLSWNVVVERKDVIYNL